MITILSALFSALTIIPVSQEAKWEREGAIVANPQDAIFYEVYHGNRYEGGYFITHCDLDYQYTVYGRYGSELPPCITERQALHELTHQ